ncbi:polyadenylate-binding protein, cytoplasmic and nuclear-like [Hyposmocoma kahamanoa]|uniref:polyadenylate-binding protein, cytoplasmic and nuclear-like n=1 Tax=Hyposmocoma kahamanoa TaxID=1477025 RepID=UPI000E6D6D19|nr:polyadenylate-binding protein, cytoplasmic and nuclear-like [Hyposmocoma kahamanoa]
MTFLTKTLVVCLSLICISQALSHYHPGVGMGMGMGQPGMGMGQPGMGMGQLGMGMGQPGMGMGWMGIPYPYGMFSEDAEGSPSASPQGGAMEEVYQPEGAEVHDPQIPQRRLEEDKNPETEG